MGPQSAAMGRHKCASFTSSTVLLHKRSVSFHTLLYFVFVGLLPVITVAFAPSSKAELQSALSACTGSFAGCTRGKCDRDVGCEQDY